jgi:hypothetical protein
MRGRGLDLRWSEWGEMACRCEYCNEYWGFKSAGSTQAS